MHQIYNFGALTTELFSKYNFIMSKINIVLYEPEIPQNTGNIARLCACIGASLYLVGKLGFSLSDKYTKRAGLDYWDSVDIRKIDTMDELYKMNEGANFYYLTTKSKKLYTEIGRAHV